MNDGMASSLWVEWLRVMSLSDYNTRVVLLGVGVLGVAAGVIGTFTLLRKRALVGDAASHATLPGIALAFIVMTAWGGDGKYLPGLLVGAIVSGLVGMGSILAIRHGTRLKEDAALGIVLSVYFGLGIALLGVIQRMPAGHAAGLESFIYGKTASMLAADAKWIAAIAVAMIAVCLLCLKELSLLCFDQEYAGARGYPVRRLDAVLMGLLVVTVVAGLQAVGLILIIALLIIPPAAARFWTDSLPKMLCISAGIGGLSGLVGAAVSAVAPRLPAGAVIVLVAGVLFLFSMCFGAARGLVYRWWHQHQLGWTTRAQHLLRRLYEWCDTEGQVPMPFDVLLQSRTWSPLQLRRLLGRAERAGWIRPVTTPGIMLTEEGLVEARKVARNHRLWEVYLLHYAHIAPHHVDHNADRIEHVLGEGLVRRLEALLGSGASVPPVPPSPHPLPRGTVVDGPGEGRGAGA